MRFAYPPTAMTPSGTFREVLNVVHNNPGFFKAREHHHHRDAHNNQTKPGGM